MILVSAIIAGVCLLAASLTDIRTREVPDLISYGMSALGLGIAAIFSISQGSWMPLLESATGFAIGFLIGMAMFYTGQWGGGDSKAIMGIGALLGVTAWSLENFAFFTFLVNMLFVGAAYGLIWSIALAIVKRKKFWPALKKTATTNPILWQRRAMMAFAVLGIAASFLLPDYLQIW